MSYPDPQSRHLFILGATHHRVPIEVREKLALSAEGAEALREVFRQLQGLSEFTVLNTCNRVEFYGVAETPAIAERVCEAFCERQQFDTAEFERFCVNLRDREAIQHLLEVASGLDSQMLGETEIFGQVKDAYSLAQARGSTGAVLNRIFQKAFQAAKQVRTETSITVGQVSVANVAVDLAATIFGELADTRVLLVGAGEIGEKTAKAFQSRGAGQITVASRNLERALALATSLGASTLPFEQREQRLSDFDIVVCATSAPSTVISTPAVSSALPSRRARPLLFVDLALPRDVEPEIAKLDNTYLYNLDDLAKVAEENRKAREAEVQRARAMLSDKAGNLWNSVCSRLGRNGAA
jgi:glutamyl-tRNA reductase